MGIETKTRIKDRDGKTLEGYIVSEELYDALSRLLNLTEIGRNLWVDDDGNRYVLTRLGFVNYRDTLKAIPRYQCHCKTEPQHRECTDFKCERFIDGV